MTKERVLEMLAEAFVAIDRMGEGEFVAVDLHRDRIRVHTGGKVKTNFEASEEYSERISPDYMQHGETSRVDSVTLDVFCLEKAVSDEA